MRRRAYQEYVYDYDLDIVNIKFKQEYMYKESVDLDVGVFLDFDVDYFPVNLEMLSVSKRLNVKKDFLLNPKGDVNIVINEDLIKMDVNFTNGNESYALSFSDKHTENLKISDTETNLAIV